MTSEAGVEALLYLLHEAFEGSREHSLLGNLRTVAGEDWLWAPPGGVRTIRQIVDHIGDCKYMYENHAFGDGSLRWSDPLLTPPDPSTAVVEGATGWLRRAHETLSRSVRALRVTDLALLRRTNWGRLAETRWIISVMIAHDLYHAGEINYIRAFRQDNDRWAHAD